jgi:polysaccharide export outer membrane protein
MTQREGGRTTISTRPRGLLALLGAACLVSAGAAGCARPPTPTPPIPDQAKAAQKDYMIGPADVLKVVVWKNPDLSAEVPVRPDGRISVPLVNDIPAAGLTTQELHDEIVKALGKYITAPEVTVMVAQVNSKRVYLVGAVQRPSAMALTVDMHVLDAIAAAGGFTPYADKRHIKILRRQPDGSVVEYRFNYKGFLGGEHPESNLRLQAGDTIVVPD